MGCYPDKPALIDADTDETLSFSQLKSTVLKLSHAFLDLGVNITDRVMIFAPNSIHFPLGFFDVTAIDAIATTINPLYFLHELSKQVKVKDSIPKLVVTVPELLNKVKGVVLTLEFHCSGFDGNHGSRTCEEYASGLLVCIVNVSCVWAGSYSLRTAAEGEFVGVNIQTVVNKFDLSLVRQIGYGTALLRKEMMEGEDIRSGRLGYCGVLHNYALCTINRLRLGCQIRLGSLVDSSSRCFKAKELVALGKTQALTRTRVAL
ncbi:hypothetical protein F3Y22_tig00110328pilonHSYRG00668 [Hibiscus syriacus]|uniref:AMP-dependent synthetase/ligase domain-containing protein n=1 Tax=Hibiscus syriacus TaxID=106335 RepID=A0A6A3B1T9_HIBSY|nr:hypothetical protein F3Y22_tig00110328pilonHSYRG00668 [Hibiscus syriacus]